ncbi:MAG: hypothetical protein HeimC2_00760 [Candidatus Heimdallarchaeota archaeon LC_2]|nr:MAG: hypothetical protein HeimC2_00760 [Candidatus Heimdallarchaeota archaeon LC_2]
MSIGTINTTQMVDLIENAQIQSVNHPQIVPSYYLVDENEDHIVHEEINLANNLEDFLIEALIQDIFYSDHYLMRMSAIRQLKSWINQERVRRIFKIIAKNEKNVKIKEFALQLLQLN